jgi:hypothetical protein
MFVGAGHLGLGQYAACAASRRPPRMEPMKIATRRLAAFAAMLAVAWTALWPLLSAAHAVAFAEPMPLCHQAGLQVAADEEASPEQPNTPPGSAKQHCPLCIMAFFGMPGAPAVVASTHVVAQDHSFDTRADANPADLSARLPESRAPPASLIV